MKHFDFKTLAMGAALAGAMLTTNAVQAQTEYTDPNQMTAGYYYVVSASNPNYAWTVLPSKEMAVAKLDKSKPAFVWYLTGRNGAADESQKGTKITDLGSAYRLRFLFGNPSWTTANSGPYYAMGGLGSNNNVQLSLISTEWGMHNWRDIQTTGFRFSASNRDYDVMPQDKQWVSGTTLWFNGDAGEDGRWKLEPVEEATLTALKAITDVETFISSLPDYASIKKVITAANKLNSMKANVGTATGQYNFTAEASDADLWGNIDKYTSELSEVYTDETDWVVLLAQMEALSAKVEESFVAFDLKLEDVNIVTLQYNGTDRYTGLNQSTNWAGDNGFGGPNGGNGKLGLIKKEEGKYAIACQGIFIKVNGNTIENATSLDDATAFITTRTTENGLTFKTEDGKYLSRNGDNITIVVDEKPESDFKINTFDTNNSYYMKAAETVYQVGDVYMSAICLPYKVQAPEGEYYTYTVSVENGQLKTTAVDVVNAGVPFIYVSATNDDTRRLIIPQTDQAYAATPSTDTALKGWYTKADKGENDTPANYYFKSENNIFGFYSNVAANDEVNQAAISGAAVESLGTLAHFAWNAESNELVAVTDTRTVTYNVVYNGATIKTKEVTVGKGDAPSIPTDFNAAFTTLALGDDAPEAINENCTITVNATWNPPFEVSEEIDNTTNWIWQNLNIREGYYVGVEATEPYYPKNNKTAAELSANEYLWAFKGNPYELYIYNKSTGEKTLTEVGDNAVMRDGKYSWELFATTNDTWNEDKAFVLRAKGTATKYINQNGGATGPFGFWNNASAPGDAGTALRATTPDSHVRTVKAQSYGTICLPYNVDIPEGVTLYSISGVDSEGTTDRKIYLAEETTFTAGTPYIFYAETAGDVVFVKNDNAANVTTAGSDNGLVGTFTDYSPSADAVSSIDFYYLLSNNAWMKVHKSYAGYVGVLRYRAYLDLNQIATPNPDVTAQKSMSIGGNGGANSIEEVLNGLNNGGNGEIYTVTGQRVSNPAKGIYIQNGKKYIVK